MAQPRVWGLTLPSGEIGGAHVGYQIYACADGRVALAALEPHFFQALCRAVGLPLDTDMHDLSIRTHLQTFFSPYTRQHLDAWATAHDIPLHTLAP
jgi:crotonobetainyl-CoA:carnitine CoA-transferase CaiB-like acyl-CoA transferase